MSITPIEINGDLTLSLAATVANVLNSEEIAFDYYCDITKDNKILKCVKATRKTLLHDYIEDVCCDSITYIMCKHFDEEAIAYMKNWFDSLNISYSEIPEPEADCLYSELEHYADQIQALFNEKALPVISEAVFAILYNNKDFLYKFNLKITEQIKQIKKEDFPDYFQDDGYLIRQNPPTWLKKGVFNRDGGRCQSCGTDLSRIFTNANDENYDHIIPLKQGGINDPTNYQLMCEHCNKSKRDRSSSYRNVIWPYWNND